MNICLLTRFFKFRGSGVTRVASEVKAELERQGHTTHCIETDGESLYSYALYTAVGVPMRLPRKGIDAYHALATMEAMWLPRDRSVATFLDLFSTTNPERTGAGMGYSRAKLAIGREYFKFGSALAARCRFCTCISEKTKEDMIEFLHVPEQKIHVIHLGIADNLEPKINIHSRFTIGTLGQLDKRKRIDLLIRQFKASKIDADLLIAGQGMDYPMLADLAGSDMRIKFLGMVPDDKLGEFYNRLDLFVFPTYIEGWGLPPVEAMACHKPVVILDDAILPTEIRQRCISVPNLTALFNDARELSWVMELVPYFENYAWAKTHTWSKTVQQYIELYRGCAS